MSNSYRELISQAKHVLLQQYKSDAWLPTDGETYDFFRRRVQVSQPAQQQQQQPMRPPVPVVKQSLPPPQPRPAAPKPVAAQTEPVKVQEVKVERKASFTFADRISARREASDAADADEGIAPAIAEEADAADESLVASRKLTEKVNKVERKTIALTPSATPSVDDLSDWRAILQTVAPRLTLLDAAPTAEQAVQKQLQQAQVWIVIPTSCPSAERAFLNDLAHALTLHELPACVVPVNALPSEHTPPAFIVNVRNAYSGTSNVSIGELTSLTDHPEAKIQLWKQLIKRG